tara:strand:+ start:66 stop:296 length:231 start_codon:yes stop_codon:yes gene_type:complete
MICTKCRGEIQEGRLKALPNTKTCVECSTQHAWYLRNIISGKTEYSETEIIKDPKQAAQMKEMDKRVGWGSNLVKV